MEEMIVNFELLAKKENGKEEEVDDVFLGSPVVQLFSISYSLSLSLIFFYSNKVQPYSLYSCVREEKNKGKCTKHEFIMKRISRSPSSKKSNLSLSLLFIHFLLNYPHIQYTHSCSFIHIVPFLP